MAIYLKYDALEGNVTAVGFEKWIELNSFQWGVGRGIGSADGTSGVRESSAASVSEITVSKQLDKISHKMLEEALYGLPVKVEVAFTRTKKDGEEEFLRYELSNTMTSGYSISSGGDRPQETLSFNFTKVMMKNSVAKADNTGESQTTTYDMSTRKNA
ncbi:type VI secretion system tube protein Hcp [Aureimonas sp. AU20]|uniref:Hcp family type VI secretion system effector n=1 Tax=Aureimonas sp. AU20 TaxID=1349819 RepID=UPI000722829F|nr:type VI secretion system tube protein Hcp [Aureimonas sp. AU20]ALN74620.1 hypothetical protein M673_18030 [Aureimonas sp. AU20]